MHHRRRQRFSKLALITAIFACVCILRLWKTDVPQLTTKSSTINKSGLGLDNRLGPAEIGYPTTSSPRPLPQHNATNIQAPSPGRQSPKGFQKRYASNPFVQGYNPTGGKLPVETGDWWQSESMWKYLSNKCIQEDANETIPDWQKRAPYAILLGAMKVRKDSKEELSHDDTDAKTHIVCCQTSVVRTL